MNKYKDAKLNIEYVDGLERTIKKIKGAVILTDKLCKDQSNGLTDGEICINAMKDIRRHLKDEMF